MLILSFLFSTDVSFKCKYCFHSADFEHSLCFFFFFFIYIQFIFWFCFCFCFYVLSFSIYWQNVLYKRLLKHFYFRLLLQNNKKKKNKLQYKKRIKTKNRTLWQRERECVCVCKSMLNLFWRSLTGLTLHTTATATAINQSKNPH